MKKFGAWLLCKECGGVFGTHNKDIHAVNEKVRAMFSVRRNELAASLGKMLVQIRKAEIDNVMSTMFGEVEHEV